jgi:hypothetical protein
MKKGEKQSEIVETSEDLTLEQIQELTNKKALELEKQLKWPVFPLVFKEGEEWIIGYMKKPSRIAQMAAFGKISTSSLLAGQELLESFLIREESDSRILDMSPMYDSINLGASWAAYGLIEISLNQSKKNI